MPSKKLLYTLAPAAEITVVTSWLLVYRILSEPQYGLTKHIEYSDTIQIHSNRLIENASLYVLDPVKQTATQKTVSLYCSLPMSMEADTEGNQFIKILIPDLPPFSSRQVRIPADLLHSKYGKLESIGDPMLFKRSEKFIESDLVDIRQLASELKVRSILETARNAYKWVSEQIQYAGFLRNHRGTLHTLKTKKGYCTEFADLFTSLCRANDIPCRGVAGYESKTNDVLTPYSAGDTENV